MKITAKMFHKELYDYFEHLEKVGKDSGLDYDSGLIKSMIKGLRDMMIADSSIKKHAEGLKEAYEVTPYVKIGQNVITRNISIRLAKPKKEKVRYI